MDEATAELLRMYRERMVAVEIALARLADENLRLRCSSPPPSTSGSGRAGTASASFA